MADIYTRTYMLLGDRIDRLKAANIAVFGLGGVGGYAAEALVRAGIGKLTFIDGDIVSRSNLNRQIVALESTIGFSKTEVMAKRAIDINPLAKITSKNMFFTADNADEFNFSDFDYVIDAIDMVSSKLLIALRCSESHTPLISSMGTGNKLDPSKLVVSDIYKTDVCPLARVMRKELRARGIGALKVVYSSEIPITPLFLEEESETRRQTPGSVSFVPSAAGILLASEVIKDIAEFSR